MGQRACEVTFCSPWEDDENSSLDSAYRRRGGVSGRSRNRSVGSRATFACRSCPTDPALQADVTREQNNINSDLSVLKIIPVLSLGFSYKF